MKPVDIPVPRGYTPVEQLHGGSRSSIWRARRKRDRRLTVLKAAAGYPPSASQYARIAAEYEILRQVSDDTVISAIELAQTDEGPVLVLEDFGASALYRQHVGPWPTTKVLAVAERVARGLTILHAAGIAHRDINPRNIARNPDTGEVKILDLASAAVAVGKQWPAIQPELSPESLRYASPEQTWYAEQRVDHRTDMYSFGVTLFELLCGTLPFSARSSAELARCHALEKPPSVQQLAPDVPGPLAQLVDSLLSKEPGLRFPSTQQLYETLSEYARQWHSAGELQPTEDAMRHAADVADAARVVVPRAQPVTSSYRGEAANDAVPAPTVSADTADADEESTISAELPLDGYVDGPDDPESLSDHVGDAAAQEDPIATASFALAASHQAQEKRDYEQARAHAERGVAALPKDAFRTRYDLAFGLHYARCEAACALNADLDEVEAMCKALTERSQTRLERMMITTLRVWQLGSRGQPRRAVDIGLSELEGLGIVVRDKPLDRLLGSLWSKIQAALDNRSLAQALEQLRPCRDPELNAATELFMALGYPLWVLDPEQMSTLSLYMAHATLKEGSTAGSGLVFASAGIAITRTIGAYQQGQEFGHAGIALAERLGQYVDETRQLVAEFIDNPSALAAAEAAAAEAAAAAAEAAAAEAAAAEAAAAEAAAAEAVRASEARTSAPASITSAATDSADGPQYWYQCAINICTAIRGKAQKSDWNRLAELPALMERLEQYKASEPPFATRYHIVGAEVARVYGDIPTAEAHYEYAIALARQHHQLHDEARANELAGCFFRDRSMLTPARAYLEVARAGYEACGAVAKAATMESEYAALLYGTARFGQARALGSKGSAEVESGSRAEARAKAPAKQQRKRVADPTGASATLLDREVIETALACEDGVITRAAKRLGVSRQSLSRRMRKLRIEASPKPN